MPRGFAKGYIPWNKGKKYPSSNYMKRICLQCQCEFTTPPSRVINNRGKFCSKKCYYSSIRGRRLPIEHRLKVIMTLQNGKNESSGGWAGDKVGYTGIHTWLNKEFGSADKCENLERGILSFNCSQSSGNYEYALLKGKRYERKRENFEKSARTII